MDSSYLDLRPDVPDQHVFVGSQYSYVGEHADLKLGRCTSRSSGTPLLTMQKVGAAFPLFATAMYHRFGVN
jgi:hypothetical protein